ncbi:DEAD/DEAH box helicase family protein [Deinococcus cellulosilyticus]|uniref:DEAD/DEAH box helicase family protein n=1 Tax=Deinococcus cellulosilyticus TaxID=401558 RepID=UPI0036D213BD
MPKLIQRLVLRDFLANRFGGDLDGLMHALKQTQSGRRQDGQSHFLSVLESRQNISVAQEDLYRMDLNLMAHQERLSRHRKDFQLLYFQYLSALFAELYLTLLTRNEAQLLLDLNAFRAAGDCQDLPEFQGSDLRTLAFWLATGAGKTLLMHLALLQFETYATEGVDGKKLFTPDARILVTPNAGLTTQHLKEFAESGIEARYYDSVPAGFTGVQVVEITKLRPDSEKPKKSSVTVPVSQFSGANLVLVDEGHKGAATASDLKEENRWRSLREALAGPEGFTLEYSATFAQVTETDKSGDLLYTYARAVAFEYAYGRFYRDGYGKDFRFLNIKDDGDQVLSDRVMLAGLLALLNKRLAFDASPEHVRTYNLKAPLMIFVGATVSGKDADSDVPVVLKLLDRVLRDSTWATAEIQLLLSGHSGLQDGAGRDALKGTLPLLQGQSATAVYQHLTRRIFGGAGGLVLHNLKGVEGEVALWAASGKNPFGVINVGDPAKLLRDLRADGLHVDEDNPFTGSLFNTINHPDSSINLLVGSKKFIEGWSSWRVSVMGLLRVGQNAGAQVMQLFGRGVRLLGFRQELKRSSHLPEDHPQQVEVQETLNLFGVKANYLQVLLDSLGQEGVPVMHTREFPIEVLSGWESAGLKVPMLDPGHDFSGEIVVLKADEVKDIKINLSVKVEVGKGDSIATGGTDTSDFVLGDALREGLVSGETLIAAARKLKQQKQWHNLYLPVDEVIKMAERATIIARPGFFDPHSPEDLRALEAVAISAVKKGVEAFYSQKQRQSESSSMKVEVLDRNHPNFPQTVQGTYGYTLQVPQELVAEIDLLISNATLRLKEVDTEPLPRLNFDRHLYVPILTDHPKGIGLAVKSTPTALEHSEIQFLQDLRRWWLANHRLPEWQNVEIWVLRNLPKTGVGFFKNAGFYPDFLLWMKQENQQALAFIDPKGVRQMGLGNEKFQLKKALEARVEHFGFYVTSFIAAGKLADAPFVKEALTSLTIPEQLQKLAEEHHILDQDSKGHYISFVLNTLKQHSF